MKNQAFVALSLIGLSWSAFASDGGHVGNHDFGVMCSRENGLGEEQVLRAEVLDLSVARVIWGNVRSFGDSRAEEILSLFEAETMHGNNHDQVKELFDEARFMLDRIRDPGLKRASADAWRYDIGKVSNVLAEMQTLGFCKQDESLSIEPLVVYFDDTNELMVYQYKLTRLSEASLAALALHEAHYRLARQAKLNRHVNALDPNLQSDARAITSKGTQDFVAALFADTGSLLSVGHKKLEDHRQSVITKGLSEF